MTSGIPEAMGELESFKAECRRIMSEPSLNPRERLYALFLRGMNRETAHRQNTEPGSIDALLDQVRGTLPADSDLKAGLICGVFLTALEASREQILPGAFAQVSSIVRIALSWGRFSAPTVAGEVDLAAISRLALDWGSSEGQSACAGLLEVWLKEPERFSRLGLVRGMGALVVSHVLMGWYARALAVRDGRAAVGKADRDRASEIVGGLLAGGTESPLEKLMQTGLFAVFFDSLFGRPLVVAALAARF